MTTITQNHFGYLPDGREVFNFNLDNGHGCRVDLINYGAIIRRIFTPDRQGDIDDIILGFDDLEGYLQDQNYIGAFIGRYANRIRGASFDLDGVTYNLTNNEGKNTLHGGQEGLNQKLWSHQIDDDELILTYCSPDGDQGFPGELTIQLHYTLSLENELQVAIEASSNKKTILSLTLHPYFNLCGLESIKDISDHALQINADMYLPMDPAGIPTGEMSSVDNTAFEFRAVRPLRKSIESEAPELEKTQGYDHCFVIKSGSGPVATLLNLSNGRKVEVFSNAPGLQLYTGNFLNGERPGKSGMVHHPRQAICLEPQAFPNAPHESHFPTTIVEKDQLYKHTISYRFGIE